MLAVFDLVELGGSTYTSGLFQFYSPGILLVIHVVPSMRLRYCLVVVVAILSVGCAGCVQRRLTIRSNPDGALVYIDNQEIGHTPVSTPFTYYGTREIKLIRDGFETTTVNQTFNAPWYQIPPLDFISDNFWPRETRDERIVDFQLVPLQDVPTDQLRQRAENLRAGVQQGIVTPLPTP